MRRSSIDFEKPLVTNIEQALVLAEVTNPTPYILHPTP